jgi:diaminohydroxyphosphoribosylaminopyrimidine deaminase / 5-amino-6-(5-phosphoribosylamino)uracil reductase
MTESGGGRSECDRRHMLRALELAARGLCTTHPNPRVGCVLAQGERVVGEGWHERAGGPHAEVTALRAAGSEARGATAYVTLEPCAHHGRTPPCADALIAAGVVRVVAASDDPFPEVNGAGYARLQAAGIRVESGLCRAEAEELNLGFLSRIRRGRPWVRIKLGMSLDGRTALADGRSQWITSDLAREDVQHWRARSSSVLTGIGTLLVDDPRLDVRLPGPFGRKPQRVVLDRLGRMPVDARLLGIEAPVLWVTGPQVEPRVTPAHVEHLILPLEGGRLPLRLVAETLGARGDNEILVEAGARLAGAFVTAGLADELLLYVAPRLLGAEARGAFEMPALPDLDAAPTFRWHSIATVGSDQRLVLRQANPWPT